jgi:type IV pilus assembly protein PilY1
VCAPSEQVRVGSSNAVNFATNGGWYIDLPETSERADTDPQLALGTLAFTTNVLNTSACTTGGTSYLNFLDYRTGGPVSTSAGVVSVFLGNAGATRVNVVGLQGGKLVGITQLRDGRVRTNNIPASPPSGDTRRISWRELLN